MAGWMGGRKGGCIGLADVCMHAWMRGAKDYAPSMGTCMGGEVAGCTDGWMHGRWIHGWLGGYMDEARKRLRIIWCRRTQSMGGWVDDGMDEGSKRIRPIDGWMPAWDGRVDASVGGCMHGCMGWVGKWIDDGMDEGLKRIRPIDG